MIIHFLQDTFGKQERFSTNSALAEAYVTKKKQPANSWWKTSSPTFDINMQRKPAVSLPCFLFVFLTLMLLKPEDLVQASGDEVSPVPRHIIGDKERWGWWIPQPGAGCHLTFSPCFELTFLFYFSLCNSYPPALLLSLWACIQEKSGGRQEVITRKESSFRSINSLTQQVCLWIVSRRLSAVEILQEVEYSWPLKGDLQGWWAPYGQARCLFSSQRVQGRSGVPQEQGLTR